MDTSTENLIQQAINAAKAKDNLTAKKLLIHVVKQEPNNARAWYLLSQVVEEREKAEYCLRKVLEIEPGNTRAKEKISKLMEISKKPIVNLTRKTQEPKAKKNKLLPWLIALIAIALVCICVVALGTNNTDGVTPLIFGNKVVYRVEGTGNYAFINYFNEQGGTEQVQMAIPWSKSYTMENGKPVSLVAQSQEYGKTIICIIELNGKEWKRSTSSGDFVVVTCTGWIGMD